MNTFSLISLVTILFLFCGPFSEEKKLPGERTSVECSADQATKGECEDICEDWNKAAQHHCTIENDGDDKFESVAICHCSIEHAPLPTPEYVYECVIDGCGVNDCEDEDDCDGRRITEKKRVVANRTIAECSEGDLRGNCVDFCDSWDEGAHSYCVVQNFEDDDIKRLASCYCSQERSSFTPPDREVFRCLINDCSEKGDDG